MAPGENQRFGPYVILDRIGEGGMAEIFLAKMQGYSGFEKLIALKKILPKYSKNSTFANMMIHEAKLAAALNHFNVVQVYDLGEIDGQIFIAMEYVRGRDLSAVLSNVYLRREYLPIELSLFIATEFLTGLEYAHRLRGAEGTPLGIIHRDISPQNILISYEGEVKVTDFGIARGISPDSNCAEVANLHGKFGYMSPEQALSESVDQRSDVFSAGVVLWEMLVGARLFRGRTPQETGRMVTSNTVPKPSSVNPDVPSDVDAICLKALSRDKSYRYQTMGAFLGALSRVSDEINHRAGNRDLSVYMRRQFGTPSGGFRQGRSSRSQVSAENPINYVHQEADLTGNGASPYPRLLIGQILMNQGSISMGDLELALAEQRAQGGRIGEVLVSTAAINDNELATALATQAALPTISSRDFESLSPPTELLSRFPRDAAEASCILPVDVDPDERVVRLAVCDPYDERGVLEAKVVLGVNEVALLVAPRSAIRQSLSAWYTQAAAQQHGTHPLFNESRSEKVHTTHDRVLIADSDVELTRIVANRIRAEGFHVDVVHDGRAAREISLNTRPIAAVIETSLPHIDGYNLLLQIRELDQQATIFLTSERSDDFRQSKALELGADDFLVKPLSPEVIVSKIRRELSKRSASRRERIAPSRNFSGVSGTLEDMTVIDIVQSLELGGKTAHVVLRYLDGRQGIMRVDAGELKAAYTHHLSGSEAFYHLAVPGEGMFRIEYRTSPQPQNIEEPNTYLMIEAMRRLDEGISSSADLLRPISEESKSQQMQSPLAEDLVLDEQHFSPDLSSLEDWVTEQFSPKTDIYSPIESSSGENILHKNSRIGRISVNRLNKPE
ncbi:MAG: protein kinase [Myxococcales bacterium]|nr:protein kinase [Myxococcales bacterium]